MHDSARTCEYLTGSELATALAWGTREGCPYGIHYLRNKGTDMIQNRMTLWILPLYFVFAFAACEQDNSKKVKVSPNPPAAGEQFFLILEGSFDDIRWYEGDIYINRCHKDSECRFVVESPGEYEYKIEVKIDQTGLTPEWKDTITKRVNVHAPLSCQNASNQPGVWFLEKLNDGCLVMEERDRIECRAPNYASCVTGEMAQNICAGDWRLPSRTDWIYALVSHPNGAQNLQNLCIQESDECQSNGGRYPNRYVLQETYPANQGAGSFIDHDIFGVRLDHFTTHVRDSNPKHAYSVRCFTTLPFGP